MAKQINCKTLLGHKNLDFSIECLQSFLYNADDEIFLEIFEDGSLTSEDEEKLISSLKNSVIIRKAERDAKLEPLLANYPACREYRNSTNFAQKLFDITLFGDGDVLYIDSDIYFLKKFALPPLDEMPVFMFDNQNAYSFSPLDLLKMNISAFPNVNTGFFYFPKNLFDLQFIEKLLKDEVIAKSFKRQMNWSEQTIWSLLAAKSRSISFFCCKQVMMANFALRTDADTVAIHLVYYFRTHIKQLRLLPPPADAAVTTLETNIHSAYLGKVDFAVEKIIRKIKRLA
ncbi:MAG: hypothetical protein EOP42_23955 [Sphingobacteriaceae bacterium]|nr:MAG: hypothetical protein EOP42_23955 [Sphingobacteriaceae bacterium]